MRRYFTRLIAHRDSHFATEQSTREQSRTVQSRKSTRHQLYRYPITIL